MSLYCLWRLFCTSAWSVIEEKTFTSLVVEDQGILPACYYTEVIRLNVTETDTGSGGDQLDDGAAVLASLQVDITNMVGTDFSELLTISIWKIGQEIDDPEFDYDKEFSFSANKLLAEEYVTSNRTTFVLNERVYNEEAIFFIAIKTDATLDNNNEFALWAHDAYVYHENPIDGGVDPSPAAAAQTYIITCVDFAGDLYPSADYIYADGIETDYPFEPHNYPDYIYSHPDALNDLQDLEIPQVIPAESDDVVVLGFEVANLRSQLEYVLLNFTSSVNGRNDDKDFWADEPGAGVEGVYDPLIDEVLYDVDGDGQFSAGDIALFGGVNGIVNTQRTGVDDDGDGGTDEEKLDGINNDLDYYIEEDGVEGFSINDEYYRDYDMDGLYSAPGDMDILVDADGPASLGIGGSSYYDPIEEGDTLLPFASDSLVGWIDNVGDPGNTVGVFDPTIDTILFDYDNDGKATTILDVLVEYDGTYSNAAGVVPEQIQVSSGGAGTLFSINDKIYANDPDDPTIIWRDSPPYNGDYDYNDDLLLGVPVISETTEPTIPTAVEVYTITDPLWTYYDYPQNGRWDDGNDIWINFVVEQTHYSDQNEEDGIILSPDGVINSLDPIVRASDTPALVFNDNFTDGDYGVGEDIIFETVLGQTYSPRNTGENILEGTTAGLELSSGDSYDAMGGISLIDEDVNYVPLFPLVEEDLQNRYVWVDEDETGDNYTANHGAYRTGVFDIWELDWDWDTNDDGVLDNDGTLMLTGGMLVGDGDFIFPTEDLNGNGDLDMRDNNHDGDFDDDDDYNEDRDRDLILDGGILGDEIYIDYDGDGLYDPNVGGAYGDVDECVYPGPDGVPDLRQGYSYTTNGHWFVLDEDGDCEKPVALSTISAAENEALRAPQVLLPGVPWQIRPFWAEGEYGGNSLQDIASDGIDNDGNGIIDDDGFNEDLGDFAFDDITYQHQFDNDNSNNFIISDIERVLLYKDNGDGVFSASEDAQISRHDPDRRSWYWLEDDQLNYPYIPKLTARSSNYRSPVKSMLIYVETSTTDEEEDRLLRTIPKVDGQGYDYFIVINTDGDDDGDAFEDFGGAEVYDGKGMRHGDDWQVSIARKGIKIVRPEGFDAAIPNANQVTKPLVGCFYMDDVIGFVPSWIQGDDDTDQFWGNPYFDATSSPIPVIGLDITNSPIPKAGGGTDNDVLEKVRVWFKNVVNDPVTGANAEGEFDIVVNGSTVTLPDLEGLADDSTGGVGLYRDDDTPEGDNIDDDGDGYTDEELLNGLDDDNDGKTDEDVGDDDPAGISGVFDQYDDPLLLRNDASSPLSYRYDTATGMAYIDLNLIQGQIPLPNDNESLTNGYDFYVVIRTSDNIQYRDQFQVFVNDQDVKFRSGSSQMNTGRGTDSIAANVHTILSDLTVDEPSGPGMTIVADSEPTAVIGINLYDPNGTDNGEPTSIEYIWVNFENIGTDEDFASQDLRPISTFEDRNFNGVLDSGEDLNDNGILDTGLESGVAIYRDVSIDVYPNSKPGIYDEYDELVWLNGDEEFSNLYGFPVSVQLFLDRFGDQDGNPYEQIPPSDVNDHGGDNSLDYEGDDYFVVIRTSQAISNGDDFSVVLSPLGRNENVVWPIHFLPVERNGVFDYTFSYESISTREVTCNTLTNTVFQPLVAIGQKIEAQSDPTAVVGININDGGALNKKISSVKVQIWPVPDKGFEMSDLNNFSDTFNSGVSIYRDASDDDNDYSSNGKFTESDWADGGRGRLDQTTSTFILHETGGGVGSATFYLEAEINLRPADIPDDELGLNVGPDFFVVLRTSGSISFKDQFYVVVPRNAVMFDSGESLGNREVTTLSLESNVPISFSDRTDVFGRTLGRESSPLPVIGMNANSATVNNPSSSNEYLKRVTIQFNRAYENSTFTNKDIADLVMSGTGGGIHFYRDSGDSVFNSSMDSSISFAQQPVFQGDNEVVLWFLNPETNPLTQIPAGDSEVMGNYGDDYFVAIRTSNSITRDSSFTITIKDIVLGNTSSQKTYTTKSIGGTLVNEPPYIELISPRPGDSGNISFDISWSDRDPDNDAEITLYYISDASFTAVGRNVGSVDLSSLNVVLDADNNSALDISENDTADFFAWDVRTVNKFNDPRSRFWVIAVIDDNINAQYRAVSPSFIEIHNLPPSMSFINPSQSEEIVYGDEYSISWTSNDPENLAFIDLKLSDDSPPQFEGAIELKLDIDVNSATPNFLLDTLAYPNDITNPTSSSVNYYPVALFTDNVNDEQIIISQYPIVIKRNTPPTIDWSGVYALGNDVFLEGQDTTILRLTYTGASNSEPRTSGEVAMISVYYDTNNSGYDGVLIDKESYVDQQEDGSFDWNISDLSGELYVYIVIDDGITEPIKKYSPATIILDRPPSFKFLSLATPMLDSIKKGDSLTIEWEAYDPDSIATITLFLDTDDDPSDIYDVVKNNIAEMDGQANYIIGTGDLDVGSYFVGALIADSHYTSPYYYTNYPFAVSANIIPSITLDTPSQAYDDPPLVNTDTLTLTWDDNDPDSEATIDFYLDTNAGGLNGTILSGTYSGPNDLEISPLKGIPEDDGAPPLGDEIDSLTWDLSKLAKGEYYIYAVITDEAGTSYDYIDAPVLVNKAPQFEFLSPVVDQTIIIGSTVTISYSADDPDDDIDITLYLDRNRSYTDRFSIPLAWGDDMIEGDDIEIEVSSANVESGTYYLVAQVDDGVNSTLFVYADALISFVTPGAKYITIENPSLADSQVVKTGNTFRITWDDNNNDFLDTAYLQFFYTPNNYGYTGTPITGIDWSADGTVLDPQNYPVYDPFVDDTSREEDAYDWNLQDVKTSGTYYILAVMNDPISTTYEYSSYPITIDKLPSLTFTNLNQPISVRQGSSFVVAWDDSDPDDNAEISLFLDTDTDPDNSIGLPIVTGIAEDPDGVADNYTVNTRSGSLTVTPGVYYVAARLEDSIIDQGLLDPVIIYSKNTVTVTANDIPSLSFNTLTENSALGIFSYDTDETEVDTFLVTANNLEFSWEDDVSLENGTIVFYFDNNDYGEDGMIISATNIAPDGTIVAADNFPEDDPFDVGGSELDRFTWDISDVTAGTYYLMAAISNSATTEYYYSNFALVINKPPKFEWLRPGRTQVTVRQGQLLELGWRSSDYDSDASINIYLDDEIRDSKDNNGMGIYLGSVVEEDGVGGASYATADILNATYYPVAYIDDNVNPAKTIYANQPVVVRDNQAPTITLLTPDESDSQRIISEDSFVIRWIDNDPDDNATISLYTDNNSFGFDGVPLYKKVNGNTVDATYNTGFGPIWTSQKISEDDVFTGAPSDVGDGTGELNKFVWDLSTVDSGLHFIYAKIADSATSMSVYAAGILNINKAPEFVFTEPNGYNDEVVQGDDYTLGWMDNDPEENATIDLYLDTDTNQYNKNEQELITGLSEDDDGSSDEYTFNTADISPGTYYPLARIADDVNDDQFVYGLPIEVLPNQRPSITIISPPSGTKVILTKGYYIAWEDDDPDNNASIDLYYDMDNKNKDGILINSEPIEEDESRDAYYWIVGDVTPATYYIYAKIYDEITEPYYAYSKGMVEIPAVTSPVTVGAYYLNTYGDLRSLSGNFGFDVSELPYFGWDIAVDFEVSSDGKVCYEYDGFGGIFVAGDSPFSVDNAKYFGTDLASDLEIAPDNLGLYLLTGLGTIHTVGQTEPWVGLDFGWNIARDLEIPPDKQGAYILDGYGGIYSIGGARRLRSYYFGWDIARSLKITTDGGYYVLDGYGNIHEFDNAPDMNDLEFGYDIARDLELIEPYTTLVYDANGGIHFATENVKLFWNNYVVDATLGIAQDIELSGEMIIPTPTITPTPGPVITPTASAFQALLNQFAEAYRTEDANALFGALNDQWGLLSPNYSDNNHETLEDLYLDAIDYLDLLPQDIADNNNEITRFEVVINEDATVDISDTTATIDNVDITEVRFQRIEYPGAQISQSPISDCEEYIDPEDPQWGGETFTLYIDDNVVLRDFGDGLLTRLYILKYIDVNEWDLVHEYYFQDSGNENAKFFLKGTTILGTGIFYKLLYVSSDCSEAYDDPDAYLAWLEGSPEPVETSTAWEFERIGNTWYISYSGFLEKLTRE